MNNVNKGEQFKMELLSGEMKPDEATDKLLDARLELSDAQLLQVLLPMAELRASQLERGLESRDAETKQEAERMVHRYFEGEAPDSSGERAALRATAALPKEVSELTRAVAADWMQKVIDNDRIGEMEKEFTRTAVAYKTEKQENRLVLSHGLSR